MDHEDEILESPIINTRAKDTARRLVKSANLLRYPARRHHRRLGQLPRRGNRLPWAPKATFNLSATYTADLGANHLVLSATFLHSAGYFFEPDNIIRQNAFNLLSATARYEFADGRYSIGAFGKNLTNAVVQAVGVTIPAGNQITTLQPPRAYGVTLGFKL